MRQQKPALSPAPHFILSGLLPHVLTRQVYLMPNLPSYAMVPSPPVRASWGGHQLQHPYGREG